ncbi:DMT family transporter [Sphingomonas sp. GlSt437]|uniref:DMT family transporter n=1 Tax=Sphingomonas sp. GlSt437 TaxID=3389970 RepID=UPI003A84D2ED
MTERAPDELLYGIALRLGSVAAFSVMNVVVKLAEARGARLAEILFFRQSFALIPVTAWIALGPGLASIRTRHIGAHLTRTAMGLISMVFVFSTILLLPLAELTALQFTVPIFATILGALLLREPTGWHRWGAVATGFLGVLIVTRPGSGHMASIGVITGLVGSLSSAGVAILLRQISKTESAPTIVFWFSLLSVPPLAIAFALTATAHPWQAWALMACVGLIGGVAQLMMTGALGAAPVSVVVPMDYSGLIWAALLGFVVFGDVPSWSTWAGAPIIAASGLYIVWREHRLRREKTERAIAGT